MTVATPIDPSDDAFLALLSPALAEGHHSLAGHAPVNSREAAIEVIDVAENSVFEQLIWAELTPWPTRLAIARAFAAHLYTSEQDLLTKVDALEERIGELRDALGEVARIDWTTSGEDIRQFAKDVLAVDDTKAALTEPYAAEAPIEAEPRVTVGGEGTHDMTDEDFAIIEQMMRDGMHCDQDLMDVIAEARRRGARAPYPGAEHPWADFLHHRARAMRWMRDEGRSLDAIAVALSMDGPRQVEMILAHVDAHPEEYPR